MQVKRFVAADMRRALEMVRQALGPEAIILSSNRIPEGVELLTTLGSDEDLAHLQRRAPVSSELTAARTKPLMATRDEAVLFERNNTSVGASGLAAHPNAGKTGQQLVAEIEKAHARRLAAQQAEASVKEFLLDQQAKTQAAQSVVRASREPRREVRSDLNQVRSFVDGAVSKPAARPSFPEAFAAQIDNLAATSIANEPSFSTAMARGQSAAERYPLVDEPRVKSQAGSSGEKNTFTRNLTSVADAHSSINAHPIVKELTPKFRGDVPKPVVETQLEKTMQPNRVAQDNQLNELQAEIADMRLLLEDQLSRLIDVRTQENVAKTPPTMASVARRLERLGLPKDVVRNVTLRCKPNRSLNETWIDAMAKLSHQIPVAGSDLVDEGGVFALVGPTGAGKTTTIGKLAARYVLKHGADKVAIITLDNYRIAAHDQLRSLARILRVPVRVVNETQTLDVVLKSLAHYELVLIDTAGFRHGDTRLRQQLTALSENRQINTLMVMPCNSQAQMLKASIHAYGIAGLKGCILTKLDETASMGEALGVVIQNQLPIVYTTHGQDIPRHLEIAKAHQIIYKAAHLLKTQRKSAVL